MSLKINLDVSVAEVKQLLESFQKKEAPLPTIADFQTSEKDYMAALDPYAQPPSTTFGYVVDKPNGKNHQDLAEKIEAAKQMVSASVPVISND